MTNERRHWHLSKAIQLPVIALVLTNVFASIWWAANVDAKTQSVVSEQTLDDKLHIRDINISNNRQHIDRVYTSLNIIDAKLDTLLMRAN